jgi:hypothetical protein
MGRDGLRRMGSGAGLGPRADPLSGWDGRIFWSGPRLGPVAPGLGRLGPPLGLQAPGLGPSGPGVGAPGPGLGLTRSRVGPTAPRVGSQGPVLGRTAPAVGATGPAVGRTGPGVGPTRGRPASARQMRSQVLQISGENLVREERRPGGWWQAERHAFRGDARRPRGLRRGVVDGLWRVYRKGAWVRRASLAALRQESLDRLCRSAVKLLSARFPGSAATDWQEGGAR